MTNELTVEASAMLNTSVNKSRLNNEQPSRVLTAASLSEMTKHCNYLTGQSVGNGILAQHYRELPLGPILCLAEGEGRNAVFLAEQGYEVTTVDASAVGLAKAINLATARGVNIHTVQADLAEFDLGTGQWTGIVSIFCHLPPTIRQVALQTPL
ncbi:MAG: class I SAM-dependent methyltransferase [Pseudohongiella sp.]|nr:class I SAM-dependent methyltransferase [Pseudohongiella sp.]